MQRERTLFPVLFNSNVSKTEIDTCPKMQKSKSFFKLNKWSINVVNRNSVELQLSRKLEIIETLFCSYEVLAEDLTGGSTRLLQKCGYAAKIGFPVLCFLE